LTKDILIQYTDLKEEIKDLEKRIADLEKQSKEIQKDIVKGSSSEFPYTEHNFNIQGVGIDSLGSYSNRIIKINRYKANLKASYDDLLELQTKAEEYINSNENSRIRRIMRYRFVDGLNWVQVAHRMGGRSTADSCRKELTRFME
jgi:polyhydroxyalkanoate synthesis regulator phasin